MLTCYYSTGTAVNPLLRAAYLSQRNRPFANGKSTVTLVLPWLETEEDRVALYGEDWKNCTPEDQDKFIREWLSTSASLPLEADVDQGGIQIIFYPARYHAGLSSIFAMGDLCQLIPEDQDSTKMICILEEPEHVNFYRAPGRESWREKL
jgi:digalactosyldiacylglycerol synthase